MSGRYTDDSDVTEITILPDGRIYVFGLSEAVRKLLAELDQGQDDAAACISVHTEQEVHLAPEQ